MPRLQHKVAIITGAGSGIGKEASIIFAQEGAAVIAADLNLEAAQKTVDEITQKGGKAAAFKVSQHPHRVR